MNLSRLPSIGYPMLVVATIAVVLVPAHLQLLGWTERGDHHFLQRGLFLYLMLSALVPVAADRRQIWIAIGLSLLVIASWRIGPEGISAAELGSQLIFLLYVASHLLMALIRTEKANTQAIFAAICLYLIVALIWGRIFTGLEMWSPGAFTLDPSLPLAVKAEALSYYSFVTISSLGYGDIYPTLEAARAWAVIEVIFGQFYIAIVVARLVSLYLRESSSETA